MDSDTEKDDEIFYYCNGLDALKSLADKSMEDFTIAECIGFGIYEELLQTTPQTMGENLQRQVRNRTV